MKTCSTCGKPFSHKSISGLCRVHLNELLAQRRLEINRQVETALREGASRAEVMTRYGFSRKRVNAIAAAIENTRPPVMFADLVRCAAAHAGVTVAELRGPNRSRHLVEARQAASLAGLNLGHSLSSMGRIMDRDHSTILHGCQIAKRRVGRDDEYARFVAAIASGVMPEAPEDVEPVEPVAVEAAPPPPPPAPKPVRLAPIPADVLRRMEARSLRTRKVLPKNNFGADSIDHEDDGHQFQMRIAAGSRALCAAILQARAAA